jgi:hypothetical protein
MSATDSPSEVQSQDPSSGLQLLVDLFENAWQSGQRPQIDNFLPPEGPDRRRLLIELVHVDLERRLKAGEAARVEQYLERYSELAADQEVVLKLLAAEFALRRGSEPNLSGPPRLRPLRDRLPGGSTEENGSVRARRLLILLRASRAAAWSNAQERRWPL